MCLSRLLDINKLRFWLEKKYFNKNFFRLHTSFVEVQILTALTFQIEAKYPETNNLPIIIDQGLLKLQVVLA